MLDDMISIFLALEEIAHLFPKMVVPYFTFPPSGYECSCVSTVSSTFDLVSSFRFSHSSACVEVLHCGLIYIPLMPNDTEHLFTYLLAIPMSFL